MQIDRMEIIATYWNEKKCVERATYAKEVGIPDNANVGCIRVEGVKEAKGIA